MKLFKRKEFSMEDEIKRAISVRILLSILILVLSSFVIGILAFIETYKQMEKSAHEQCSILSEFTVSQLLIDNASAVQFNIKNINRESKLIHFQWIEKGTPPEKEDKIRWKFPVAWVMYCSIKSKDNQDFGYFKVSGSLVNNYDMLSTLLMRVSLSCCFVFIIFLLLYPLGKRIPRKIFVNPILDLLSVLKQDWKDSAQIEDDSMPVEIREIKSKLIQLLKEAESYSHELAFAQIAAKVAHDIRSPLAALNMLLSKNIVVLPSEDLKIMKSAIERINTIADNLLESKKDKKLGGALASSDKTKPELAAVLVKNIVSEKQVQYEDRDIQFKVNISEEASRAFVDINASELTRALSNLMNNSVEAIETTGMVVLSLSVEEKLLVFTLEDTGKGMLAEQLSEILEKNISIGKENGSGIGLSSAIQTIRSANGEFYIHSVSGKGTSVIFRLPIVPPRFLCRDPDFIFIDDSIYLTDAWQAQASLDGKKLVVFNTVEDVERYIHLFPRETPVYIDSELGSTLKGEDLARCLYDKGFTCLYLCTGKDDSEFSDMPWIKKILGKEYPHFS